MLAASILIVSILTGISVKAAEVKPVTYFVQIGAFQKLVPDYEKVALKYGEFKIVKSVNGLHRYLIGPFATKYLAEESAGVLKSMGYLGSFVSTVRGGEVTVANSRDKEEKNTVCEGRLLASLPDYARSQLVYIKDVLHVREGDELISVENYLKRNRVSRKVQRGN